MRNQPLVTLVVMAMLVSAARADDWPQWLGPRRDAVWHEAGVARTIPPGGLPVRWRVPSKPATPAPP